jgi:hypothetical protein
MNAPRWRGWFVAVGILLFGIAIGAAGVSWAGVRLFRETLRNAGERGFAERTVTRIGADLTATLQLTDGESARVRAILDESATRLKTVRAQAAAQAVTELRIASQRIAAELPPGKRAEYRRLLFKRYERLGLPPPLDQTP